MRTPEIPLKPLLVGSLGALALLAGACSRSRAGEICLRPHAASTGAPAEPVATFDNGQLTTRDVKDRMNAAPMFIRAQYQGPAQKRGLVDQLAETELLAREAVAQGLQNEPDVVQQIKMTLAQKLLQRQSTHVTPPTEAEIEAYYEGHKAGFARPEQLHAYAIFIPLGASAKETAEHKRRAEGVLKAARALKPTDYPGFQALAEKNSEDPWTRATHGDMYTMRPEDVRTRYGDEVMAALAGLKGDGELAPIVQTAKGFYVLKLAQHTAPYTPAVKDMEAQIRGHIALEHQKAQRSAFLEQLKAKYHFQLNEAALAQVNPDPPTQPASMPGGINFVRPGGGPPMAPGSARANVP